MKPVAASDLERIVRLLLPSADGVDSYALPSTDETYVVARWRIDVARLARVHNPEDVVVMLREMFGKRDWSRGTQAARAKFMGLRARAGIVVPRC